MEEVMKTHNPNRCALCLPGENIPSFTVAETGYCGACGRLGEVWDLELLEVYRQKGLSDEVIHLRLPRLRVLPGRILSAAEIRALLEIGKEHH